MATGTIKRIVRDRGFMFIKPHAPNADELFAHRSAVIGVAFEDLAEGQEVSYREGRSDKGPRAEDVKAL